MASVHSKERLQAQELAESRTTLLRGYLKARRNMHVRFLPWLVLVFLSLSLASPLPSARSKSTVPEELSHIVTLMLVGPNKMWAVPRTRQEFNVAITTFSKRAFHQGAEDATFHIIVEHSELGKKIQLFMHTL
jgi:hypothetical protein